MFDPASYPQDDHLNICGLNHLEALLAHYGERKETPTGPINRLNPDAARGECLMFKRLVLENRGEDQDEQFHVFWAEELFKKLFSGANSHNQRVFPGKIYPLTLNARRCKCIPETEMPMAPGISSLTEVILL